MDNDGTGRNCCNCHFGNGHGTCYRGKDGKWDNEGDYNPNGYDQYDDCAKWKKAKWFIKKEGVR